jgi:serine/threonine-protein kinase
VRSDWFCSVATLPPLYHDLLQLPQDLAALERDLEVDVEANLAHRQAKRGGMAVSGVSRNNRAVERHPYRHGAYWKSIDYASSKGHENIFTDPIHLQGTGGEMIFNLPNGLQAYYVTDHKGTRLNEAPTSIVTDRFAEDKTVRNGLSCIRCHDRGMKEFRDDVRPAVEKISGSGSINRREVLGLYPSYEEMTELVGQDRDRFLKALEQLFGAPQEVEPLIPVSQKFLDAPLQLNSVCGELGLSDAADLKAVFRQPHFTGLGLVSLTSAGVVRRDMWEDYFDQVVRGLGLGVPVVPLDGLTRPDYRPQAVGLDVQLSTSKKNNVFAPGDQLNLFVENRGKSPVFIELIGSGTQGEKVILVPHTTTVAPGQKFRFPESGSLTVQAALGKEQITLFASESAFPAGRIFRGKNVDDRVVHDFYRLELERGEVRIRRDASSVMKRTIEIETR